jgi:hypothetical protein
VVAGVSVVLAPIAMFVWGCNAILGIEEQGRRPDRPEAQAPDAATVGSCTKDADCIAPDACYTPHCDTRVGRCWYGLCETAGRTCTAGTCNTATGRCEGATDYGFRTTSYATTIAPACADPADCVTALWPFVFIGTSTGVVAMFVDDPIAKGARSIPVSGFEGAVTKLVASGARLWILGTPPTNDGGEPITVPLGFIDVPSDPTVRRLDATTTRFEVPFAPVTAFAAPNGALYLAVLPGAPTRAFPTSLVTTPLPAQGRFVLAGDVGVSGDGIELHPAADVPPDSGSVLVASSGDRLIAHQHPSTYLVIASPGSASARAQATSVVSFPPTTSFPTFAQGRDGALLLAGALPLDDPNDCSCASVSRVRWLFANGNESAIDQATAADVESYRNPQTTGQPCHECQDGYFAPTARAAWIDEKTALVATAASDPPSNRGRTAVQVVTRNPVAVGPRRRFVTSADEVPAGNFAVDRIALTADRGIGYLVISDATNRTTLSIFDPRCEAPGGDGGE